MTIVPPAPLISLNQIAVRLRDRRLLAGTCWRIERGQQWAVMGPNGAGKSTLVRAVAGELPVVQGRVERFPGGRTADVGYVSFELHRRIIAREEGGDDARCFSGDWSNQTTVRQLFGPEAVHAVATGDDTLAAEIRPLLDRTIRTLSTGEIRKVLIARAVARSFHLLILDEPFDGLDASSRRHLMDLVSRLMAQGRQLVLVTHREAELPREVSHILTVADGKVVWQGRKEDFPGPDDGGGRGDGAPRAAWAVPERGGEMKPVNTPPVLIEMRQVSVRYGGAVIIDNLDWTVRQGEHWAISGPNGAGKTTLLRLISGDHPQAYANEIYIFGRRRGNKDSIWEVKAPIGMVSAEFQIRYRKNVTALEVVISGVFDSVGLYRRCTPEQERTAWRRLRGMGIEHLADRPFPQLSQGEQRLVLLARAMVKSPALLILDEPCQGLDHRNRSRFLAMVEALGRRTHTHILYVTHHAEEIPACMTHHLRLSKGPGGGSVAAIETVKPHHS